MILFRSASLKERNSLKLLSSPQLQKKALSLLNKTNPIDDVFSRPKPLSKTFASRFGAVGMNAHPFYTSEKPETTLYEYGAYLLTKTVFDGIPICVTQFEVELISKQKPLLVVNQPNYQILLDKDDYSASQAWVMSLNPLPEIICYPSVREPLGGGTNFAIFKRSALSNNIMNQKIQTFCVLNNQEVEIVDLSTNSSKTIQPII